MIRQYSLAERDSSTASVSFWWWGIQCHSSNSCRFSWLGCSRSGRASYSV